MVKQNSVNTDITNNTDGMQIAGGITARMLKWLGADITLTGSGTNTYTFPASSAILLSNQAAEVSSFTDKPTPVGADIILIEDSAASSYVKKKLTLTNLEAYILTAPVQISGTTGVLYGLEMIGTYDTTSSYSIYVHPTVSVNSAHFAMFIASTLVIPASTFAGLVAAPLYTTTTAGTLSSFFGISSVPRITAATTRPVTNMYGVSINLQNLSSSGSVLTNAYSLYVTAPTAIGAITNNYGLYIEPMGGIGGTLNYAIYTNSGSHHFGGAVVMTSTLDVGTDLTSGKFGANGAAAQAAYSVGSALAAYATGTFGYNSAANAQAIHDVLQKIRTALIANGIAVT